MDHTSFITGQLGYDIPTTVKNIFCCTAKQKVLNPNGKLYIGQTGSDRLEGDFGGYRSIDSPNFDILQLGDCAGTVRTLSTILARHPSWDRGHRRLKLEGTEGVDHTNPASWRGDVSVKDVSLLTCWNSGRWRAREILAKAGIETDFDLQGPSPNKPIDILHPDGDFVGLREEPTIAPIPPTGESALDEVEVERTLSDSPINPPSNEFISIQLEDILPEPQDRNQNAVFDKTRAWLDVDGKSVHKASAVNELLGVGNLLKSKDHLRKVCSYSLVPSNASLEDDSLTGTSFIVGHLMCSFLHVDNLAAFAIVHVTSITNPSGTSVISVSEDALSNPKVIFTGQVVKLKPSTTGWTWSNEWEIFCKPAGSNLNNSQQDHDTASKSTALVSFPATSGQRLGPGLVPDKDSVAWNFPNNTLVCLCEALWDQVKGSAALIPTKVKTETFPYRDTTGVWCATFLIIFIHITMLSLSLRPDGTSQRLWIQSSCLDNEGGQT